MAAACRNDESSCFSLCGFFGGLCDSSRLRSCYKSLARVVARVSRPSPTVLAFSYHVVVPVCFCWQIGSNGRAYSGVFYPSMQEIWPELYSTSNIRAVEVRWNPSGGRQGWQAERSFAMFCGGIKLACLACCVLSPSRAFFYVRVASVHGCVYNFI